MSYLSGTVLRRTVPFGDVYDTVRVVAASPIQQSSVGSWAGAPGEAVIVTPADSFGNNETMLTSYAQRHYEIVSIPTDPSGIEVNRLSTANLKSPEQQFAAAQPIAPKRPVPPIKEKA